MPQKTYKVFCDKCHTRLEIGTIILYNIAGMRVDYTYGYTAPAGISGNDGITYESSCENVFCPNCGWEGELEHEPNYGEPGWDEYVETVRARLNKYHGEAWDTDEVQEAFSFAKASFFAPFVLGVVRRSDGKEGNLTFMHSPRFYYDFR